MPMKLRDGKIYTPQASVHMLLRDGKLVDARQQISNDGKNFSISTSPGKGKSYNFHEIRNGLHLVPRSSLIRENRAIFGSHFSKTEGAAMADSQSETVEQSAQEITQEVQIKTVSSTRKKQIVKTTRLEKLDQVDTFSVEDDSGFITSTPLLHSTTAENEHEESFTFSGQHVKNLDFAQDKNIENSFTHIKSKTSHVLRTPVSTNHGTKLLSSGPKLEGDLEHHVFEDLSKSLIYSYLSDDLSDSELQGDQTDSVSFKKKSLSYPYMSRGEDLRLNHESWGKCHDWRRQWYLNRWNMNSTTKVYKKSWITTFVQTIITTFITMQSFISLRISNFLSIFTNNRQRNVAKNRRLQRISTTSVRKFWYFENVKEIKKTSQECLCFFLIPLCILLFAAALAVLFIPLHKDHGIALNLTEHGLKNANSMILDNSPDKMPVWHIFPEVKANGKEQQLFDNGFPIVFYLRDIDSFKVKERIDIFKVLSAAGYNIVTPVYAESGKSIIKPLNYLNKAANGSRIYLWGDKVEASYMSALAKDLCKEGVPPSGVIILTDVLDTELPVQSYEVWSCNCSTAQKEDGTPFAYTHIKCPVSNANIHRDITDCLQALNK